MDRVRCWQAGGLAALTFLGLFWLFAFPAPAVPRPHLAYFKLSPSPLSTTLFAPRTMKILLPPRCSLSEPVLVPTKAPLVGQLYAAGHSTPHPELCPALGARIRLLVLVTSAPAHAAAREAVRLTWGHYGARSDVALAFMLGTPPPHLTSAIAEEDALYNDVIVGHSIDTYWNLTLKTLSILEWTDTYCPRAPKLLKTDDDVFINVPGLLDFVSAPARVNAKRMIWGRVVKEWLPSRTTKSKYFLSMNEWGKGAFPDFTTGPAYLMTSDCVRPLLQAATHERYLRLEDVFVTGVLAQKVSIKRVHAPEFYNRKIGSDPCVVQRTLTVHMVRYHEQFDFWRKLVIGKILCVQS